MVILPIIALVLAGAPLLLAVDNLRRYLPPDAAANLPNVSVLIPARNEEANIADAAAAILASRNVQLELIVLDDNSTDRTPDILREIADDRLRVVQGIPLPPGWSRQAACMRHARHARAL